MERMVELRELQRDLLENLASLGFVGNARHGVDLKHEANANEENPKILASMICAGYYPQVARVLRPPQMYVKQTGFGAMRKDVDPKDIKFFTLDSNYDKKCISIGEEFKREDESDISITGLTRVFIHPSSINFNNNSYSSSNYIIYSDIVSTTAFAQQASGSSRAKAYIREASEVPPLALLFLGGRIDVQFAEQTATVDKWIKFCVPGRVIALVLASRRALDELLRQAFAQKDSRADIGSLIRSSQLLQAVVDCISCNGML